MVLTSFFTSANGSEVLSCFRDFSIKDLNHDSKFSFFIRVVIWVAMGELNKALDVIWVKLRQLAMNYFLTLLLKGCTLVIVNAACQVV